MCVFTCMCADTVHRDQKPELSRVSQRTAASLGPSANDHRQCYDSGPVCEGQASSEKVRSCTPAAALTLGAPLAALTGPVLVHQLHNTCATLRLSGVQLLQGLFPLGDGITDLQDAKEQSEKPPMKEGPVHSWTQAEQAE